MTFDQFYNKHNGELIDVDGAAGVQCCDLVKLGMKEMWNIPYFSFGGSAKNLYEDYNSIPQLNKNFDRIKNTKEFVPDKADIVVWNGNVGKGNGHCAFFMEGDSQSFDSFDQNWGGKAAHKQHHANYKNIYGVLRKKSTPAVNKSYFPRYDGNSTSIVDALCKVKAGTSYAYRKDIAKVNGIDNYRGTPEQNAELVRLIKQGKLIKP